jgi:hypothetical protein
VLSSPHLLYSAYHQDLPSNYPKLLFPLFLSNTMYMDYISLLTFKKYCSCSHFIMHLSIFSTFDLWITHGVYTENRETLVSFDQPKSIQSYTFVPQQMLRIYANYIVGMIKSCWIKLPTPFLRNSEWKLNRKIYDFSSMR